MKLKLMLCGAALAVPFSLMGQNADPFGDGGDAGGGAVDDPFAADSPDPFAVTPEPMDRLKNSSIPDGQGGSIRLTFEVFSMSMAEASGYQRSNQSDVELLELLLMGVEKNAVKQEVFLVARGSSGHRVTAESIVEEIYPTEWEPAELPNYVTGTLTPEDIKKLKKGEAGESAAELMAKAGEAGLIPMTPATPTAFDTRNTGITFESESITSADGKTIDVRFSAEKVEVIDIVGWGQGLSRCEMPIFASSSLSAGLKMKVGVPYFVGTMTPRVERAFSEDVEKKEVEARAWMAFVTAAVVK
ncbi:MAG: hypothetical protein ACSHYF_06710 [Verrucomicrobiaceae bacterium]